MSETHPKLKAAILGSGNIGTDLLVKVLRSPYLECALFIGRRLGTPGMAKAASLGMRLSDQSIDAIVREPECCDLVFDATSAADHMRHAPILERLGKIVVDLTPSNLGVMCVPAVNLDEGLAARNVSMVTCGGQVSIPLAHAIAQVHHPVDYIEVVSTIASRSAGPGTRINMDEYVMTTERGVLRFSHSRRAKAILNINPAEPPIIMQTTVFAQVRDPDVDAVRGAVERVVEKLRAYVPGYRLISPPVAEGDRLAVLVEVQGRGDYLQRYAGNLDIINCAALATAEAFAQRAREPHA